MAFYQILYWQDIPSQIKAWDDFDEVKLQLAPRFMEQIDQTAQKKGLTDTDDYLDQWNWSDKKERDGDPDEVAEMIKNELEDKT
jgi:hypothetical protein